MITREDVESFLTRVAAEGATYEEVEQGLWAVRPGGVLEVEVAVSYTPPVLLIRVQVMPVPEDAEQAAALNRKLLELNATDLLHGAYGIDGSTVVLAEALELSHLDYEEFLASYESITLSLASHVRELANFSEAL